ncbi:MAG: 1-acyl-sn-glycerol-3-phosphate acyltransferase [Candidatus Competibacteraceae bacterium]
MNHLPGDQPCLLVSNHASYLDSFVLAAVLPSRFSYVAKRELRDNFWCGCPGKAGYRVR